MDTESVSEETQTPDEPSAEGTFKKVFLAPGRAMVAVNNAMSSRRRKLAKGHWSYNIATWICAGIVWFAVLAVVVGVLVAIVL